MSATKQWPRPTGQPRPTADAVPPLEFLLDALVERLAPRIADQVARRIAQLQPQRRPEVRLLGLKEAAQRLGLPSVAAARKAAQRGQLPVVRHHGRVFVRSDHLDRLVASLKPENTTARNRAEGESGEPT